MSIVTHVPSIILKPEFEIYKTFFGMPPRGKFDINAIKVIKNIIERNLGANYDTIETALIWNPLTEKHCTGVSQVEGAVH